MSEEYEDIVMDVGDLVKSAGHTWQLTDGNFILPDYEDIRRVLDKARETLYDGGNNQIEVAGLLIRSNGKNLDIYVKAGTMKGKQ